ncbi:MAG: hydroxymethylbilane synthase [Bacteroidota bacterium]
MPKPIRIGTRESELAMYQAKVVQNLLEDLGHQTQLIPIKSTGDIVLDKPIYELGITGVFTKTLDIAMLNGDIDLAVHSLKDVPTVLPKGIVQAATIKRGNHRDCLVFKNNEEFLSQREGVIATGSLRRRAQWLNRYPTHTVVGLRGNVNSRLKKLEDNDWNGAIFAAAGLGRLQMRPEESFNLDWMVPAPGQGAIMVTALEANSELKIICEEINDKETEICTKIERDFLHHLEGGCSAPIGAHAYIKDDEVNFHGVLLSLDGTKKIEIERTWTLAAKDDLARFCANYIIEHGGKRLMDKMKLEAKPANIFSTKNLTDEQKQKFHKNVIAETADFIKISLNRISPTVLQPNPKNVIITSKNAVEALLNNFSSEDLKFENIYCVGRRTKRMVERKIGKVKHVENSARQLADYLVEFIDGTEVTYFCSNMRLDELPDVLEENNIDLTEVVSYETKYSPVKIPETVKGVMFYSPSTVQSFKQENVVGDDMIAFCIGETTAKEASRHFQDVRVAKMPSVDGVVRLVNAYFDGL